MNNKSEKSEDRTEKTAVNTVSAKDRSEFMKFAVSPGKLPISLSVETECGLLVKIAEIGDPLPIKTIKIFSTDKNVPEAVLITFYAGERPFAKDNKVIGSVKLNGIKALPSGRPVVSLSIEIDVNCNIIVEATDEGSVNSIRTVISNNWIPSRDEIVNAVVTAQENLTEDTQRCNKARLIQQARESLCRAEIKFKTIRKNISLEKAVLYKQKIKNLKSKLKKIKADELTDIDEKSLKVSINELSVTVDAE